MSPEEKSGRLGSPASKRLFQRLLGVLLCLAILAVGVNVAWWLSRPALEPLPTADTEHLDAEIQELIASAVANVAADNRSATAWGDLGAGCAPRGLRPSQRDRHANRSNTTPEV